MTSDTDRDRVFAQQTEAIEAFTFDERVASVFDDMLARSVPGYRLLVQHTAALAQRFLSTGGSIYDLGASLGTVGVSICATQPELAFSYIAVDNAEAMVARCRENVESVASSLVTVDVRCADVLEVPIENASFVVCNLTLQFLPMDERDALVRKIYAGLKPGGAFMLTEKLDVSDDPLLEDLYYDFKRINGYSELEISQKRDALDGVLVPEADATHRLRLENAGFEQVSLWFRYLNFVSYLAVKAP